MNAKSQMEMCYSTIDKIIFELTIQTKILEIRLDVTTFCPLELEIKDFRITLMLVNRHRAVEEESDGFEQSSCSQIMYT